MKDHRVFRNFILQIPETLISPGTDYVATVYAINNQTLSDPALLNFRISKIKA